MSEDRSRVVVRLTGIGESVTEVTVVRFLRKPGDAVKEGEPVLEVETDKATIELTAPEAGVIESLAIDETELAKVDDALYVLRTGGAPPAIRAGSPSLPSVMEATLRWDATHVQARARSLAEPAAEAALILTAVARALAAAPGLVARARDVVTTWVEVDGESARWVCGSLAVDVSVAGALALARTSVAGEPAGWRAQVRVLRVVRGLASPRRTVGPGLQVLIGPVRDEAVVVGGAVVIRPMATISALSDTSGRELLRFLAVLGEQLGQV